MTQPQISFVIGGCRSGKSRQALALAETFAVEQRVFIATCVALDEEMRQRVTAHQKERGGDWQTVEAPLELSQAIATHTAGDTVVLVDCLTLWISNLIMETEARQAEAYVPKIRQLVQSLATVRGPIVLVSNEVGTGIVPENKMARLFRDVVGILNQEIARAATRVIWMVAGIPVKIKPCS